MNKILNVNLGGYALTIDDDAYEYLHRYLEAIRSRFSASDGRDEIIGDIESRMGELLHQKLNNRTICTRQDVENVVKVMGKPEDFGDATSTASGSTAGSGRTSANTTFRSGRRFFRDEDDKVIGGVCSGLAAYLGVQDPVWIRLAFVVLGFFSAGFWFIAYIVLMVVVPAAVTSADRLAMRGEPINVDNIAKEIENGFENISNRVSGFSDDLKKKSRTYETGTLRGTLASVLNVIGGALGGLLRMLGGLTKGVAFLIAIVVVIALILSWLVGFWSFFEVSPHLHYFSPLSQSGNYAAMILGLLVIGLPVLSFFIMLLASVFKGRIPRFLQGGIWIGWTSAFIACIFFAAQISRSFKHEGVARTELNIPGATTDTLYVQWQEQDLSSFNFSPFEEKFSWSNRHNRRDNNERSLLISDQALAINLLPEVRIAKSLSTQFEILTEVFGRGASTREADENASKVGFKVDLEGNTLFVPKTVIIPKGDKLRTYDFNLNINVPVGKYIVMREGIHANVQDADFDEVHNNRNRFYKEPNQVFLMTKEGLVCVSCASYGSSKFESDEDYSRFTIEGNIDVELIEGDEFMLDLQGFTGKSLVFTQTDDQFRLVNNSDSLRRVTIRCREIEHLDLKRKVRATLFGFDHHSTTITLDDHCELTGKADISNLDISVRGNSRIDLLGSGGELNLRLQDNSEASLFNYKVNRATVLAKNNCTAEIFAEEKSDVLADKTSKVNVSGDAKERKTDEI
jgi:phage shock protein PspC (stress-responsive transcriptional regulator)